MGIRHMETLIIIFISLITVLVLGRLLFLKIRKFNAGCTCSDEFYDPNCPAQKYHDQLDEEFGWIQIFKIWY
jgi:hypothetical protein